VRGSTRITVITHDGAERPGVFVGDDFPFTDIAVIRVQPDGLTVVPIGDSDAVQPGQGVLTIGSVAFNQSQFMDFRNNVTRGIVSGTKKRWPKDDTVMEDLIQTDAAINHGNSGGALVTLDGKLIGITTTVIRGNQAGQQVEGVGFAISSRTFTPLLEQIVQSGKTERPYVGIIHRTITQDVALQLRLPVREGALVADVEGNSPAAQAGVQRGDVITKLGDIAIDETHPYLNALVKVKPNSTVPLTVLRGGQELKINIDVRAR
jgi:S1-C subfamily serine protease